MKKAVTTSASKQQKHTSTKTSNSTHSTSGGELDEQPKVSKKKPELTEIVAKHKETILQLKASNQALKEKNKDLQERNKSCKERIRELEDQVCSLKSVYGITRQVLLQSSKLSEGKLRVVIKVLGSLPIDGTVIPDRIYFDLSSRGIRF